MVKGAASDDSAQPRVEIKADTKTVVALRLAKAGWFGGDPGKVLSGRVDLVVAALQYEGFLGVYERTWRRDNKA